ncbi:hypothetical protein GEV33_009404 [Tenebrio molitor]|uniref:Uncharacterized protein n=1 Tax=Tenebrio molitor TaxID=7067 RepID=A0A8J6HFV6_TENMO|nr:hypothetical protein GEV33_009404 [Tenebrio molitor]
MVVTNYREIRADSPTLYRNNIREFPGRYFESRTLRCGGIKKNRSSAKIEDSVGDCRAGGCAASREERISSVAIGIRNHPRERIADPMVCTIWRCQVSAAAEEPEDFTVLPLSSDPSHLERERGSSIQLPYRTVREYRKVLLQNYR